MRELLSRAGMERLARAAFLIGAIIGIASSVIAALGVAGSGAISTSLDRLFPPLVVFLLSVTLLTFVRESGSGPVEDEEV